MVMEKVIKSPICSDNPQNCEDRWQPCSGAGQIQGVFASITGRNLRDSTWFQIDYVLWLKSGKETDENGLKEYHMVTTLSILSGSYIGVAQDGSRSASWSQSQ